jgi:hypothetical protein
VTRVVLRRSGGFAGLTKQVDTDDLPPEVAAEIAGLAEHARLEPSPPHAVPDSFIYDLQVGDHRVTLHEHAVPESVKPLLDRLKRELR